MGKNKKIIFIFVGVIILGLATYFYFSRFTTQFVKLKRGDIQEAVYGLGKVKSNKVYELKVGIASTISNLFVHEGSRVQKGQNLVRLEGSSFTAPFEGVVTFMPFHEKENVFPQSPILRLEDLNDLYIEVSLEQQGALRILKDQEVKLSFETIRGSLVSGTVDSIFPKEDQFVVRIKSGKLPEGVLPGMTVDVAIEVGRKQNVLLIPLSAVTNGRATIIKDGRKKKIPIVVGAVDGSWAEVIQGDVDSDDQAVVPKR